MVKISGFLHRFGGGQGEVWYVPPAMKDHIYKIIELTGTSTTSIEDAVNNAIKRASQTVHGLRWFVVTETRGDIDQAAVKHWQVTIKIGFTLDS